MMRLQIGTLRLEVQADTPGLLQKLESRYRPFLSSSRPADLDVTLQVRGGGRSLAGNAPTTPMPRFAGPRTEFDQPGFRGSIDLQSSRARLSLAPDQADDQADYFLRVCLALLAHRTGGLLVHAAGIVRQGRAFLFFGLSGSGKTTVARCSPPEAVLNDDLVLLLPEDPGWRAWGTPFSNPTQVPPRPDSAPAAGLLRLVQSLEVRLEPLHRGQALAELLASVPVLNAAPQPPFERCEQILADLPAYFLHFLPDPTFWPLVAAIP